MVWPSCTTIEASANTALAAGVVSDADEPRTVGRGAAWTAGGRESPATGSGGVKEIAGMVADDHRGRTARLWAVATVRNGTVSEGDHPNGVSEESNVGITRKPRTSSTLQYRRSVCRNRPRVSV